MYFMMELDFSLKIIYTLLGMALLLCLKFLRVNGFGMFRKIPPGPFCFPVLGSVGFFREFRKKRHLALMSSAERHGKVFSVRAGSQLVVFLNDFKTIQEAFVKKADVFSDRPNWLPSLQAGLSEGGGLVWQSDYNSTPMRKFALRTLRGLGVGKSSMEQKTMDEIGAISDYFRSRVGEPVMPKPLLKAAATNLIHDLVFGTRFDYEDKQLSDILTLIEEFFKGGLFIPRNFLPVFIQKLLPKDQATFDKKQIVIRQLKTYINSKIDEHEGEFDEENIRDFIDVYIQSARTDACDAVTRGNIFRTILDLFLAGAETTATTLQWCILLMVKYPDIQERCFQEIEQITSESTAVDTTFKGKLPYTEATLLEVQRHCTVVPVGVPHATNSATTLYGFYIPEKTIVFSNLYACAMDDRVWSKPHEFMPDRHIDEQGKLRRSREMIQFGIGPRACLGETMANTQLFLFFTNLLKTFKFSPGADESLEVNVIKQDQPIASAANFQVIVQERANSSQTQTNNNYIIADKQMT